MEYIPEVLSKFSLDGNAVGISSYGEGHINSTFIVVTDNGMKYILQRINTSVFHDAPALMRNIELVTEHIRSKSADTRNILTISYAKDGRPYVPMNGEYYRIYNFIENSMCLQRAECTEDFYQSAIAFGGFSESLSDFDASRLSEVIAGFHNTPRRYDSLRRAIAEDRAGRADSVKAETDFILEREDEMSLLQTMRDRGELPVRVTHNDTKLNNVLFDKTTRRAIAVIDLDTVMPGLSLYDFGDSIRFGASAALEDEKDLGKVWLSLELYRAYAEGYCRACRSLTPLELEMLPYGAKTMTIECGMRFLTDYINGDVYFSIKRKGHNLDRCRTQLKLAEDMERHWDELRYVSSSILSH